MCTVSNLKQLRHHGRLTNVFSGSVLILFPFSEPGDSKIVKGGGGRERELVRVMVHMVLKVLRMRCEVRGGVASNMAHFQRLNYARWM